MRITKPSPGRIVEFTFIGSEHPVRRPAVVVRNDMGGPDGVNLQVWLDGRNDLDFIERAFGNGVAPVSAEDVQRGWCWQTSVHFSTDGTPGTWRYPTKTGDEIDIPL